MTCATPTPTSLRTAVGVVTDEPFLFSAFLTDDIAYARPRADRSEVEAAARAAQAHEFVMALPGAYDEVVGERGCTLSGGQRQRIALARAFLARPWVLVLDEATSNLDLQSETRIERALDVVLEGRTAIVIAHRLATAMRADRIAAVVDGALAELGTHDELVAQGGHYAAMYATWTANT